MRPTTTARPRWSPAPRTSRRTASTYAGLRSRVRQLANALRSELGVGIGDRIATLAWNDHRHFELYYGIAGIGAICHTINPRLFPEQIAYIVNHAEDRYLFVDPMFVPLVERLAPQLKTLEAIYVLADAAHRRARSPACALRAADRRPAGTIRRGRRSTRPPPAACATPRAPPACPRARSTTIARPSCTRSRSRCPTRCG